MAIENPGSNLEAERYELEREIDTIKARLDFFLQQLPTADEERLKLFGNVVRSANSELGKLAGNPDWIASLKKEGRGE